MIMKKNSPIGIFDSGLGGISVLHEIHAQMPLEDLIFFGDSANNPYGTKTPEQVIERCDDISKQLVQMDCKAIVIACNTATSVAASQLRKTYPIDIIGMEPALKVAAELGSRQHIAVWATELTLKEEKFARLMSRFEKEHTIVKVPCPKLVRIIEEDALDDEKRTQSALKEYLAKSNMDQLDSIVLGCTHFVFFKEKLKKLLPENVQIVDGNAGTARHLKELMEQKNLLNSQGGNITFFNTADNMIGLSEKLLCEMEDIQ
jgi:glutamate racemase